MKYFLIKDPRLGCYYSALRLWLLKLLWNFHVNAKVFPRKLKGSFIPKPLRWKNKDDILTKQEDL